MTPLRLVVYINGARFFPVAVNATFEVGNYSQFTVTVPTLPDWTELPVRSVVSVFYADPVEGSWRLLVDGEYVGRSRAKTSAGTRSMQLACRGHLAWTTSQTFATLGGAVLSNESDKVGAQLALAANGFKFEQPQNTAQTTLQTIPQFFANAANNSADVTQMFRLLLRSIAYQSPVDAYYYKFRHLFDAVGSVPDTTIQTAFSNNRFLGLLKEWNSKVMAPDQNAPVESILTKYLDMAFYRHTPLPAAPAVKRSSDGATQIKSQFLVPALYETVPPASNIIFADQIVSDSESINWLAVPSRVTTRLTQGVTNQTIPLYYVSTDASRSVNISENPQTALTMLTSHGLFSLDELTRGVRNVFTDVRLENAEQNGRPDVELAAYLDANARYNYTRIRGEALRRTFTCQFLPYLMPGFPGAVEDLEGSIYGYIESVTHSIDHTGVAATTVSMSHVRDLRVRPGNNKNGPLPVWLNAAFKPDQVDATYADYFGVTTESVRGASATRGFFTKTTGGHPDSVDPTIFNMDEWLATIMFVPRFNKDGVLEEPVNTVTIADSLRANSGSASIHRAMLGWQYRQGCSLQEYAAAYGLDAPAVDGIQDPPLDLSNGKDVAAFGTPIGMLVDSGQVDASKETGDSWYVEQETSPSRAGVFNLVSSNSVSTQAGVKAERYFQAERQRIARTISERLSSYSIERMAVPDGTPLAHRPVTP